MSHLFESQEQKLYRNNAQLYVLEGRRGKTKTFYIFNGKVKLSSRSDGLYAVGPDVMRKLT